jgi:hypothetical protein
VVLKNSKDFPATRYLANLYKEILINYKMNASINIIDKKFVNDESERNIEIYLLTNKINNKKYVGQTVSHVLNNKKYVRYGTKKRFDSHVSETFSSKENQCHYLNNAIKKYGPESFSYKVIATCSKENSDTLETKYILEYDTVFPNGYNLKIGGQTFNHSDESKKRLSKGVTKMYEIKKFERFKDVILEKNFDIEKYIHPLKRNGEQMGWYVLYKKKKVDFGGVHITLEESKKMAEDFFNKLTRE